MHRLHCRCFPSLVRLRQLSVFLLVAIVGFPASAQTVSKAPPNQSARQDLTKQEKLDLFLRVAEQLRAQIGVPGVGIGIVYEKQILFRGGLGLRDVENKQPVTADTLFAIGSLTKSWTGLVATKLVSREQLDWDQPIASYLPDFQLSDPYVTKHVTLADACSHMTGLARADHLWKGQPVDREQVFSQAKGLPFVASLRKQFGYNNHMYVVVGKVIESVTEKSWEDNIRDEIIGPLKMTDTYVTHKSFINHPRRAIGYSSDGITPVPHVNVDNVGPAGAVTSTPNDFIKWLQLWSTQGEQGGENDSAPLLTPSEFKSYASPRSATMIERGLFRSYWAGWSLDFPDKQLELRHSGGIDGQNAVIYIRPYEGFGIFVLTNQRSEYKDLIIEYADQIFLKNKLERDEAREFQLIESTAAGKLHTILAKGQIDQARAFLDSRDRPFIEEHINELGYWLMSENKITEAEFLFRYNVENHPESANVYDSLAECLFKAKRYQESITHYRKSLELDADNENAKSMIEQIQKLLK